MLKRMQVVSRRKVCVAASLAAGAVWGSSLQAVTYTGTNLSALFPTGTTVTALGLNANDQVVGYYSTSGGNAPFIYTPGAGVVTIAGVGVSSGTQATGINNAGVVVGTDGTTGDGFIYSGGTVTEVSPLTGTGGLSFNGINNNGIAVGTSNASSGAMHVVTYSTATKVLSDVGAGYSGASASTYSSAINDAGTVLGFGVSQASAGSSTAHYQPFTATPVNGGGFNYTNVGTAAEANLNLYGSTYPAYLLQQGIDTQGNVTGSVGGSGNNTYNPYVSNAAGYVYNSSTGTTSSLGNLVEPAAIADVGGAVETTGTYFYYNPATYAHEYDAFVTVNGTLNNIARAVSGYSIFYTSAINSKGDILATGYATGTSTLISVLITATAATVTYTGGASNLWNTTAANFTPTTYADGYNVVFDDTATGSTSVNIPSAVAPGNVTFNNNTKNYVISGAAIGGGSSSVFTVSGRGSVTLNNVNTFTGPTNVSSGTLVIGSTGSVASTTINVLSGATLNLQSPTALPAAQSSSPSLVLNIGGTVLLQNYGPGAQAVDNLNTLSIAGTTNNWTGKLDLANNDAILYRGNLTQTTNQVKSGYAGGTWQGTGIASSAAASNSTHLTAIGVIEDSVDQTALGASLYTNFNGVSVYSNNVLVAYTYYGDANLDGQVDGSDYSRIDAAYLNNQTATNPQLTGWYNGDFNYDGVINGSDYTLIDNAFNTQGANLGGGTNPNAGTFAEVAPLDGYSSQTAAVPEPALLSSVSLVALSLLCRRKRQSS